jgi:hypothetical protein
LPGSLAAGGRVVTAFGQRFFAGSGPFLASVGAPPTRSALAIFMSAPALRRRVPSSVSSVSSSHACAARPTFVAASRREATAHTPGLSAGGRLEEVPPRRPPSGAASSGSAPDFFLIHHRHGQVVLSHPPLSLSSPAARVGCPPARRGEDREPAAAPRHRHPYPHRRYRRPTVPKPSCSLP